MIRTHTHLLLAGGLLADFLGWIHGDEWGDGGHECTTRVITVNIERLLNYL